MAVLWQRFGFRETPYQTTPLESTEEDARLFTGRKEQADTFLTYMDTTDGCVVVVSGESGVGKTSFLNVQQYLMWSHQAILSPSLVRAIEVTQVESGDDAQRLAQRITSRTVRNVIAEFKTHDVPVPKQITKIDKWLSHRANVTGYDYGVSILGVGGHVARSFSLPNLKDTTLEAWQDVLAVVVTECLDKLKAEGVLICIDNSETLPYEELSHLLMSYRDTLFKIKRIWWVVVGQSQLYSLLCKEDTRVSQRIRGGVEIPHMDNKELYDLVQQRIRLYRCDDLSVSPLSEAIHEVLFEASRGIARFVLEVAEELVNSIENEVRERVHEGLGGKRASREVLDEVLDEVLGQVLFDKRLPDKVAREKLAEISVEILAGMKLTEKDIECLEKIGRGDVSADDYVQYGMDSAESFADSFLKPLSRAGVLQSRVVRGVESYRLRNYAYICMELEEYGSLRKRLSEQKV